MDWRRIVPTKIPWAHETVNFCSGCVGPTGTVDAPKPCTWCYAARMANRLHGMKHSKHKYRRGFLPTFHPEEIDKFRERAKRWRKPRRIFVNSMGDIMDPGFTDDQIRQQIQVAADFPNHVFMFLSKRPERYADFKWPENAWLGASATDQEMADVARSGFHWITGQTTFLSCEPLLGPISLNFRPSWVILGSMTGPRVVPPKHRWIRDLTDQADRLDIRVFHKPNLEKHFGSDFQRREFPGG